MGGGSKYFENGNIINYCLEGPTTLRHKLKSHAGSRRAKKKKAEKKIFLKCRLSKGCVVCD